MRNSDLAWRAATVISGLCLSAACVLSPLWVLAVIPLVVVVLWLVSKHPGHGFRPALFLSASAAFAALGIYLQLSVPLLLMGTAAALAAWDLAYLADRLGIAVSPEHRAVFQRSHLLSLAAAIAAGLMLTFLTSVIRLQLPFGVVSLLALVLVLALAGIPRAISAKSEHS